MVDVLVDFTSWVPEDLDCDCTSESDRDIGVEGELSEQRGRFLGPSYHFKTFLSEGFTSVNFKRDLCSFFFLFFFQQIPWLGPGRPGQRGGAAPGQVRITGSGPGRSINPY